MSTFDDFFGGNSNCSSERYGAQNDTAPFDETAQTEPQPDVQQVANPFAVPFTVSASEYECMESAGQFDGNNALCVIAEVEFGTYQGNSQKIPTGTTQMVLTVEARDSAGNKKNVWYRLYLCESCKFGIINMCRAIKSMDPNGNIICDVNKITEGKTFRADVVQTPPNSQGKTFWNLKNLRAV